ncbi:MAG: TonB-dependent receptor [Steroidobacteraceae bacterium]|nr:TonB-dependent receptor [Steroidobacteraceae bacterium]
MENTALRRAVRLTLIAAATSTVGLAPVYAQDKAEELEMIVVTGSRIAKRDNVSESPILTLDAEAIADSGYVTAEQFLNTMPQIVPGISSQSNNPSSNGRAFVDLRGLGSGRNLVLIDGRRPMGSTSGGTVDVNTIPTALIERVEIISGGAASTYGPDAVSGVVNFIMKRSFDGVAVDSTYRITDRGDGEEWGTDITFGGKFADDRGNAVFNASYFSREAIYKGARGFSAQASTTTGTFPGGGWSPGTNTPSQAALDAIFGANTCNTNGGQAGFGFNPNGSLFCTGVADSPRDVVGYNGPDSWIATNFYPDFFSYNFEPDNILVLPLERWSMYSHFDLDLASGFKPYATAMFTNYNALQELAPTPAAGTTGFTVPVTNPFIPAQMRSLLATRANPNAAWSFSKRFNDLGGRTGYNEHDVWQITAGAKGDISDNWRYDVYYSYGRSNQNEIQGGNVRRDRTQTLLNAADGGASLCAGGLNLFGSAPISQACKDYISLEAKNLTVLDQNIVEGVINGELYELPAGMLAVAVGASYRDIDFNFKPDSGLQPGLVAGFNQQLPISGYQDFVDYFAEVSVPLLKDLPGIQQLTFTGGYRQTDSSATGKDDTYKAMLDWAIVDSLRFRGGFQHAVRSPTIGELYAPQVNNFPNIAGGDPCNTTGAIAATYRNGPNGAQVRALCNAQSAVAGGVNYVQPFGQATAIVGGNPDLDTEKADSWTAGLVFNSPWEGTYSSNLTATVDYWSIELEDVIAAVSATDIIQRCYNRDNANPTYDINNSWCQLFNREQSNGGVIDLEQLSQNQAAWSTSGVDLTVNWGIPVGAEWGDLAFQWVVTWIEKFETQTTAVDPTIDYVGTIGSSSNTLASTPEYKTNLTVTWSLNDLQLQAVGRYIDSMEHANSVLQPPAPGTGVDSVYYVDLSAKYDLTENLSIRGTVNNVFDEEPQLYTPNVQANTDPSLYDVLGTRYFVGINFRM